MRLKILLSLLILSGAIFILQDLALQEYLYWRWWWFDILMHFLGGILIGGIALIVSEFTKLPLLPVTVVALIGIGIGWELFEWVFELYDTAWDPVDTSIDLIMDTLGAFLVYGGIKLWK